MKKEENKSRADRVLILIALILFLTSTLLMFRDDFSFENPLGADSRKMGNILQGEGDIRWKRFDRLQWESADEAETLFMKDQLFVGKNSHLEIELDGVKVKLQQNTLISIRKVKGVLDLQIMYGKLTLDKPEVSKKIAIRNQHNQTVWKSDETQSIKTVDISNETVMYKTDNVAELEKLYWVSTPAMAEPMMEPIPEPPVPVAPPLPVSLPGLKMARALDSDSYHDIEKIEKRKDLIAQNTLAEAKPVTSLRLDEVGDSRRKIFTTWTFSPMVLFKSSLLTTATAHIPSNELWAPGFQVEYRRRAEDSLGTTTIPFMYAPSMSGTKLLHMARTGIDYEQPGPFANYLLGARLNYENYVSGAEGTGANAVPIIGSRIAVPVILGLSKQWVDGAVKNKASISWCPTYSVTSSTTNFMCVSSSLNSYWMTLFGMNLGTQLFVNYYNLDLGSSKLRTTEAGVGLGAQF